MAVSTYDGRTSIPQTQDSSSFVRVIDEVKRAPESSSMREFGYLWSRLQEFLVEEREEVNAKSIELSLKSR